MDRREFIAGRSSVPVAIEATGCSQCEAPATHVVATSEAVDARSWPCQFYCEAHAREINRLHPERPVASMPGAALIGGGTIHITAFTMGPETP